MGGHFINNYFFIMKKDNNINNFLNIACKVLGAGVSIVTIAKGIKQLCTSESPAKKRKEDEKFFERKQQIELQAHQEKLKAKTASYEEKCKIAAKYKNTAQSEQADTFSNDCFVTREERSIFDIVNNPTATSNISLIRNYVTPGGITMIYSPDGNGKSCISSQICLHIAKGEPCLFLPEEEREPLEQQYVLSYDIETEDDDFVERYGGIAEELPKDRLKVISDGFSNLDEFFNDLVKRIDSLEGNVFVNMDSLSTALPSMYGNESYVFFKRLKELQRRYKNNEGRYITVLIINHSTKDQDVFWGDSRIGNITSCRLALLPCDKGDEYKIVKVEKLRKKGCKESFIIKRVAEPWLHFEYYSSLSTDQSNDSVSSEKTVKHKGTKLTTEVATRLDKLLTKQLPYKEIAKELRLSTKTIQRYVKEKKEVMAQAV